MALRFLVALALCAMGLIPSAAFAQNKKAEEAALMAALAKIKFGDMGSLAASRVMAGDSTELQIGRGPTLGPVHGLGVIDTGGGSMSRTVVRQADARRMPTSTYIMDEKGEIHSAAGLPTTKPTAAEKKAWLDHRGVCPAAWYAKYMKRLGYPHRKDCDKPRPMSLFERYQGIDMGTSNTPYH